MEITFKAELWEWQGQGAWCFVSLPKEYYDEIKTISSSPKRGFGSVKIEANIGKTLWRTSIFPDTKSGTYLLPIKKAIRKAENLSIGSVIDMKVRLIDF
jgi:hypothetical protein